MYEMLNNLLPYTRSKFCKISYYSETTTYLIEYFEIAEEIFYWKVA